MLDIQFIRYNPELVKEKSQQKNIDVDATVDSILEIRPKLAKALEEMRILQQESNELARQAKGKKPAAEQIVKGRQLKDQIRDKNAKTNKLNEEYDRLLRKIPNMPLDDVPVGKSEEDNVVAKTVGEPIKFDFEPKSHWQIGEAKDWIDKERAAKVSGARFAYIKGNLARLQFAIINFVLDAAVDSQLLQKLIDENKLKISNKPFTPVLPPAMLKTAVFEAMDRLDPADDRYKVGEKDDDLWLQGSAEHTLGPMYKNEILQGDDLPIRLIGYSSSFRREAGSYGKDTEGIIRMHQFDKLEMEVFSTAATGLEEHKLLIAIQEYLVQQLKLSYQVIQKCTADIGKPNARGIDIDSWFPSQGKYRETHTADYMTDYQARRLQSRVKTKKGNELLHTNDATAFALGRTMAAIIENYQDKDGNVTVPEVLQPYMQGRKTI